MIQVKNLSQSYRKKKVLENVNFTIGKNELCALVGRNGAGKSTLIHSMLGILPVKNGSVHLNGISLHKKDWKKHVAYLPEKFQLYTHLTGLENMKFFASLERSKIEETKIEQALRSVGLWEEREQMISEYSKGMLQRLGLAVMLYYDSEILILDEPTSGLDPIGRIEVLNILKSLENKTILLSSHHLDEIQKVCTHVAYLENGMITKYTTEEFTTRMTNGGN
ncbi:ABC transporter ATP-binding protein [Bacillus tianshenii]|nr:ABC transporter ATP-binding protein [Bacillus tianshenii]